mmetsp:Transcript_494/g.1860  ORF Transcript_494/g.1860 Transcript_494/m.1860 type:complete len:82 (+) Transcript_494:3814-4059(+)
MCAWSDISGDLLVLITLTFPPSAPVGHQPTNQPISVHHSPPFNNCASEWTLTCNWVCPFIHVIVPFILFYKGPSFCCVRYE